MNALACTALALITASGAGHASWNASPGGEREATRRIYRRVLERASDREHRKILQTDLSVDDRDWSTAVEISSRYYVVKTTNPIHGRRLGSSLDRQLERMQELLQTSYTPPRPFPVWILPTVQEYSTLGEASDEHSSFYASYYSPNDPGRPVICLYSLKQNTFDVLHSAVHQYVDAAFPRRIRKTWISEGLAHYLCLNVSEHYRDWASAQHSLKIPRYTPLSSLVHEEGLGRFGNSTQASVRLLQLALLFRFLLEELPDTARDELEPEASFAVYLREVLEGREPRDGFQSLFLTNRGMSDLDQMFREFRFD